MEPAPVAWIIDPDHWGRALLRAELCERGADAIGFESIQQALTLWALHRTRKPALIVLDLPGLDPSPAERDFLEKQAPLLVVHRPRSIGEIAQAASAILFKLPPCAPPS